VWFEVGDSVLLLAFSFALVHDNLQVQHNEGLELNGRHQLLVFADDNIPSENISTTQKNTEALLDTSKCREN
jgi:hypothetical protein